MKASLPLLRLFSADSKKGVAGSLAILLLLVVTGCSAPVARRPSPGIPMEKNALPRLGYTIQAGAFASAANASALTRRLQESGLDSTYFVARRGLYKVRFGNFPTREKARARAEELKERGIIEEFYIVAPEKYAVSRLDARGEEYLREELVRTARSFLGVDYLWGGESAETGFDCSGLTMTVYQLNGLVLPRNSRQQFAAGNDVGRSSLRKGDLVFFTGLGEKVSHVGIYIGSGQFIHAPGRGKKIRIDTLEKDYFSRTFAGARSYL